MDRWLVPALGTVLNRTVCLHRLHAAQATVSQAPLLGPGAQSALALVGCFTFKAGTVLAAVTKAEQVSCRNWLAKLVLADSYWLMWCGGGAALTKAEQVRCNSSRWQVFYGVCQGSCTAYSAGSSDQGSAGQMQQFVSVSS